MEGPANHASQRTLATAYVFGCESAIPSLSALGHKTPVYLHPEPTPLLLLADPPVRASQVHVLRPFLTRRVRPSMLGR